MERNTEKSRYKKLEKREDSDYRTSQQDRYGEDWLVMTTKAVL